MIARTLLEASHTQDLSMKAHDRTDLQQHIAWKE